MLKGEFVLKLFLIAIIYNVINIAYSYNQHKKGTLSNLALVNLVFSFLFYIVVIVYNINHSWGMLPIPCWIVAYLIVYFINKSKQKNA